MKKIYLFLAFIFTSCSLYAQTIAGTWYGVLNVQGHQLHVVFHIAANGDTYTGTMDSPDQGANGLPMDKVTFASPVVTVEGAKYNLTYTGTFSPAGHTINGTFNQGGLSIPLNLSADKPAAVAPVTPPVARRIQDPKDFPYKQEEVVFDNTKGGNRLAGTLTMPSDGKVSKIVVLITGSGPQNRDEEIKQFNHRPFLVWSDWLTRNGIAVLRYDDRGIGKSTGVFSTATSADFADDAEAAVSYIQSRADLKNLSIGLMGHSEGGMIAPIVASRNKLVKFIVLLAGPGVPITELMLQQDADQMRLGGASPEAMAKGLEVNRTLFDMVKQYPDMPAAPFKAKIDSAIAQNGISGEPAIKASAQITSPWYRYFLRFNPADYIVKVKCPVLALNGTLDMQVNAPANLAAIKLALTKGGNKRFEVMPLPGLNHLFQKATTGSLAEYAQIEETVNPAALQKVSGWINGL